MDGLPQKGAALHELQAYIQRVLHERGFDDEDIEHKFLLFVEEVGELAKAIRQGSTKLKNSSHSKSLHIKEEAGDVLILFLDLCNKLGLDAEEALYYKESINVKRTWH